MKLMTEDSLPTKGAMLLFLLVSMLTIALSAGSTIFSLLQASNYVSHSNQQWCNVLNSITDTKPAVATNPTTQPGRVYEEGLYTDFVQLKINFGCK